MSGYEVLIPVIGFVCFTGIVVTFFYLSHKNKLAVQETVRKSLDNGTELTPEILDKLSTAKPPRVKDLRRGVVLVAIGLAAMLTGSIIQGDADATRGFIGVGLFPLFIGAGFLLVWKLNRYNY